MVITTNYVRYVCNAIQTLCSYGGRINKILKAVRLSQIDNIDHFNQHQIVQIHWSFEGTHIRLGNHCLIQNTKALRSPYSPVINNALLRTVYNCFKTLEINRENKLDRVIISGRRSVPENSNESFFFFATHKRYWNIIMYIDSFKLTTTLIYKYRLQ